MEYGLVTISLGTVLGFLAGAALTWTSPEIPYLNSTDTGPFNGTLTSEEGSWIGGMLSLGAIFGPFVAGFLADKIGRKYTMLVISIPFMLCSILLAFSNMVAEFYVARFITGVCVGGTFTMLPMYVGEIASDKQRGVLGSSINVSICLGLLFSYVAGSLIENIIAFNLVLAGLTAGFFVLFLLLGSESPHWYISKNKHDLAKKALQRIRGGTEETVEKELEHIRYGIESETEGSIADVFKSKGNLKALLIGCGLTFFQQTSGINAILFFAQTIFEKSGTSLKASYCSMIIGSVQFGTSFINPLVSNLFGRKFLLVFSGIGMFIFEGLLGTYSIVSDNYPDKVSSLNFLPVLLLISYIIVYNVGFGPLPWAMMGEIFPSNIKSTAGAIGTSVCWLTSFVITKWFSQLIDTFGQGQCFLGFAVASLLAAIFSQFVVIETKGKTLAQIQEDLNK